MTHIFLGVTIVGIILTVKVALDGINAVAKVGDQISALKIAIQNCQIQTRDEETLVEENRHRVEELKTEVAQLVQKEKDINSEIRGLRAELDGKSFKIDM